MGGVVSLKAVLVAQHATGHLATMSGATEPLLADRALAGLGEAQLRARPAPCLNAIAWVLCLCWPLSPSAVIFWQLRHMDAMIRARGD